MFDTHILPILEYNSEIWFSHKEIACLEKIQMKFLKNLLGVKIQTSTLAILADTGRFPLILRQQVSALKYYERLKSGSCPQLLISCYEIQKKLFNKKAACWLSKIYTVIENHNTNLGDFNVNKVAASLFEHAQCKIMNEINDSNKNPKLRTYKLFKNDYRLEPYLNYNIPKSLFRSIARLRLSSHNLNIELGRHRRPYVPPEDRICQKCDLNEVDDEVHCLIVCSKWNKIRADLFQTAQVFVNGLTALRPREQFIRILTDKNLEMNIALGKFLSIALRNETIDQPNL